MATTPSALHRVLPATKAVPRIVLATRPTPLLPADLSGLVPGWAGRALVKGEASTADPLGGLSVRTLEFVLGGAAEDGRTTLVTSGGAGSGHLLATALYAPEAGLDVHATVFPHHMTPASRLRFAALVALGPAVRAAGSAQLAAAAAAAAAAALRVRGRRPQLVEPGGTPLGPRTLAAAAAGMLGAVECGLEIAEQVTGAGPPEAVFCAAGSGMVPAGLAAGLALGGLDCELVAVASSSAPRAGRTRVAVYRKLLDRWIARIAPDDPPKANVRVRVDDTQFGGGYAEPTAASSVAREDAATIGLDLDPTHDAKAFAAFLEAASRPKYRSSTLVFVATRDASVPTGLAGDRAALDRLPGTLRRLLG